MNGDQSQPNGTKEPTVTSSMSQSGPSSFSPATEAVLQRVSATSEASAQSRTPGWEAARDQVLKNMVTSDQISTSQTPLSKQMGPSSTAGPSTPAEQSALPMDATPSSTGSRGRGRGRGRGRPRGSGPSGRGSTGRGTPGRGRGGRGGRGGKRKRADEDEIKAEDDSDSETYEMTATMTKSGRNVQKPTTFVPPPSATLSANGVNDPPGSGMKRKRHYNRKNPESTVCKVCYRPHSPTTNMIVFCDVCNAPYHRYCHHPPIEQEVVDVPEMEWFCAECKADPSFQHAEPDIEAFVGGTMLSEQQKRNALSGLPKSILISLIVRASASHPELAFFPPPRPPTGTNGVSHKAAAATSPVVAQAQKHTMPPPALPQALHPQLGIQHYPNGPQRPPDDEETIPGSGYERMLKRPSSPPSASDAIAINGHRAKKHKVHNLDNEDGEDDNVDEGVEDKEDEDDDLERLASNDPLSMDPPALYPKSGYGLARQLRPESEDMDILVDDNQEVYTHVFQADAKAANEGIFGMAEEDRTETGAETGAKVQLEAEAKITDGQGGLEEG